MEPYVIASIILVIYNISLSIILYFCIKGLHICETTEHRYCPSFTCVSTDPGIDKPDIDCGYNAYRIDKNNNKICNSQRSENKDLVK